MKKLKTIGSLILIFLFGFVIIGITIWGLLDLLETWSIIRIIM